MNRAVRQAVAAKHYLPTTDEHFAKAADSAAGGESEAAQYSTQRVRTEQQLSEQECEKPDDCNNRRVPIMCGVGDTGPATLAKSSGKSLVLSGSAAESAAVDAELAIVIDAWPLLAAHSRSIIVGMARKSAAKATQR